MKLSTMSSAISALSFYEDTVNRKAGGESEAIK